MANATKRPQDVCGTHFFAPANVMKLFEVVKGAKSAPDTTNAATGRDMNHQWGWMSSAISSPSFKRRRGYGIPER